MPPALFEVSNITSIEQLLISYHFKCYGMFQAFTKTSDMPYQGEFPALGWAPGSLGNAQQHR